MSRLLLLFSIVLLLQGQAQARQNCWWTACQSRGYRGCDLFGLKTTHSVDNCEGGNGISYYCCTKDTNRLKRDASTNIFERLLLQDFQHIQAL